MATVADVSLFDDGESVGDVIRRVFVELGSNVPARIVTQWIIDHQLLPVATLNHFRDRGLTERVRKELAKKTKENLPFAQPTGIGKDSPWQQLDLFTADQGYALVSRRANNLYDDYAELVSLRQWCIDKFGDAPEIPLLSEPGVA